MGFAVAEGILKLDDTVLGFFPEYAGLQDDPRQKNMTVRDLITMRSGHGRMISGNEWRPIRTSWICEKDPDPEKDEGYSPEECKRKWGLA